MFIQHDKIFYNLDSLLKYELIDTGYLLTFIRWEVVHIQPSDEKMTALFKEYVEKKFIGSQWS